MVHKKSSQREENQSKILRKANFDYKLYKILFLFHRLHEKDIENKS